MTFGMTEEEVGARTSKRCEATSEEIKELMFGKQMLAGLFWKRLDTERTRSMGRAGCLHVYHVLVYFTL